MANELRLGITINHAKGAYELNLNKSGGFDIVDGKTAGGDSIIGTTEEQLPLGDVNDPFVFIFYNADDTHAIQVGFVTGVVASEIPPKMYAVIPPTAAALFAKALGGNAVLIWRCINS